MGWNPLTPNGLPVATHAKAVREAILSAWGQHSIDDTAQLARFLFLSLAIVRDQKLTLIEALEILEPDSQVRAAVLPHIHDPQLRILLSRLDARFCDARRASREEDRVASTIARLQSFVLDPLIRTVLTQQQHSLDMDSVLTGKVLIANVEHYRPMRPDDVKLICRMLINDILAHVFARPGGERKPVFLVIDEVHTVATLDLCVALELGRELGLKTVIANQFPRQLADEGEGRLLAAVNNCARTKVVFGGLTVADLEPVVKELVIDQYDDMTVKDELTSLEVEPVNRMHLQIAETETWNKGTTRTRGTSNTTTDSETHTWSYQDGETETETESESSGTAHGAQTLNGVGETVLPNGEIVSSANQMTGGGTTDFSGSAHSHSRSTSRVRGATDGWSTSEGEGTNESTGEQEGEGGSTTRTWVQVTDYIKRRVVSSRAFLTLAEFLTRNLQRIQALPQAHFVLKAPNHLALFVRGPNVRTPVATALRLVKSFTRVYSQPYYASLEEVTAEEESRTRALLEAAEPQIKSSSGGKEYSEVSRKRKNGR